MATITRRILSASANGKPVAVTAVASPGAAIHVLPTATHHRDFLRLLAGNTATLWRTLTLEIGGTSSNDQEVIQLGPQSGLYEIFCPRNPLTGVTGATIAAFATATGAILIFGYVNRFTTT